MGQRGATCGIVGIVLFVRSGGSQGTLYDKSVRVKSIEFIARLCLTGQPATLERDTHCRDTHGCNLTFLIRLAQFASGRFW